MLLVFLIGGCCGLIVLLLLVVLKLAISVVWFTICCGGVAASCGLVALWFSCVVGGVVGLVYLVFACLFTSLDFDGYVCDCCVCPSFCLDW